MYYAQIDEKSKVHTICELAGEVKGPNLVTVETWDESLIGKYYDAETDTFEELTLAVNKETILADGKDAVTVTAKMPKIFSEAVFRSGLTREVIAALPVDPATRQATLKVTATTPGKIVIMVEDKSVGVMAQ